MTVLFGHPTGNPNSHHAALAHFEAGWLEALCVPWMPTPAQLALLACVPGLRRSVSRLRRRSFAPLLRAPRLEGRGGEWLRMLKRLAGGAWADERLAYQANDWLMRTMSRACGRATVSAVHAYEDCSLWQFEAARAAGKACIYDLPIGYYPAWEATQAELLRRYPDWAANGDARPGRYVRREQKLRELALADLVLAPSSFVGATVLEHAARPVHVIPYGVDAAFWQPAARARDDGILRVIFAGQCSLRKGTPLLIEAWKAAALDDAELELAGPWRLPAHQLGRLPAGLRPSGALSASELRARFQNADVLVLPSFFEGFALVILEAMACGLPVIASDRAGAADLLDGDTGRVVAAGDLEAWVHALRWIGENRRLVPQMGRAARARAASYTWERYRRGVVDAVRPFV